MLNSKFLCLYENKDVVSRIALAKEVEVDSLKRALSPASVITYDNVVHLTAIEGNNVVPTLSAPR